MDAHHCSRCRKPLPPDAAQTYGRLCPRCVLAVLAAPVSHPPDAPTEIAGPPDPSDPTLQEPRFQPGDTFGPYRIGRLLGRGGMGEVYEAEHSDQGRRIALKVLNQRLRRADDRTRFLQEGRLAASINHPNSVYIFGSEEIDGIPVIGMELLPGGTLKGRVNAKGTLPVAEAVDAILQVIAGLDAAHAAGVLHRDIKPSNCFIDHGGIVKVGDFGLSIPTLSRPVSSLEGAGAFQGTPDFASPEQLRGDSLDVRADIYAVGATLFYLLTGQPPSAGQSPRDLQPTIPWSLDNLISRCLAKSPDARFRSYAPLAKELQPFRSVATTRPSVGLRLAAGIFNLVLLVPVLGVLLAILISTGLVKTVGAASTIVVITLTLALVLGPRRPKSHFASLPDLLVRARRIRRGPTDIRPAAAAPTSHHASSNEPQPQLAPAQLTPAQLALVQLGPYVVISPLGPTESGELFLAQDPRLNRQVWVHVVPYGTPPAPSSLSNATRPGALHWLSGQRFAFGGWDAYEAPDGAPLMSLSELQPWKIARHWLLDLASELQARLDLGLREPLDLGRVWITRDGRAKLLDFHAPAARVSTQASERLNTSSAQRFLCAVASHALGPSPVPPVPLSAAPTSARWRKSAVPSPNSKPTPTASPNNRERSLSSSTPSSRWSELSSWANSSRTQSSPQQSMKSRSTGRCPIATSASSPALRSASPPPSPFAAASGSEPSASPSSRATARRPPASAPPRAPWWSGAGSQLKSSPS
jgi:hypothetical protein